MPGERGKLAEISAAGGRPRHRADRAPSRALVRDRPLEPAPRARELANLFVADIEEGIDALDYGGPVVRRTRNGPGSSKSPAAPADPPSVTGRSSRRPPPRMRDGVSDPDPLRARHWRLGPAGALAGHGAGPARAPVARRQGRGPCLSPRARSRPAQRRVRPILPLARRRRTGRRVARMEVEDGHADRIVLGHGRRPARLLGVHGGSPGSPGCSAVHRS